MFKEISKIGYCKLRLTNRSSFIIQIEKFFPIKNLLPDYCTEESSIIINTFSKISDELIFIQN